jgi:hypothetical protein
MNKNFKELFCKLILMIIVYCFSTLISFALIEANWRECANAFVGCNSQSQSLTPILKTYVIESAGYFLNSHSDYQAFLNRVEMSEINGIDYNTLREILYSAIENIEKAKAAYSNLKTASEKIPYNQAIIDKLMKFDYDGFQVQYELIEPIFTKVKIFLSKGDIAGFDLTMLANMDMILSKLYIIKSTVDKDQLPEISRLWRANQAYTEAQLFGQYMSEIFKDILF